MKIRITNVSKDSYWYRFLEDCVFEVIRENNSGYVVSVGEKNDDFVVGKEDCEVVEEYVPFTWEDRDLIRGKWLKHKEKDIEFSIECINKDGTGDEDITFESWNYLFENFTFLDGSVFGKEVE